MYLECCKILKSMDTYVYGKYENIAMHEKYIQTYWKYWKYRKYSKQSNAKKYMINHEITVGTCFCFYLGSEATHF